MEAINNFNSKNEEIVQTYRSIKESGGELDVKSIKRLKSEAQSPRDIGSVERNNDSVSSNNGYSQPMSVNLKKLNNDFDTQESLFEVNSNTKKATNLSSPGNRGNSYSRIFMMKKAYLSKNASAV